MRASWTPFLWRGVEVVIRRLHVPFRWIFERIIVGCAVAVILLAVVVARVVPPVPSEVLLVRNISSRTLLLVWFLVEAKGTGNIREERG